jgi:DNA-binding CsgD family transcriptional regulator
MSWSTHDDPEIRGRSGVPVLAGSGRFVGRTREFDGLRARLDDAHFGKGGIVMIAGEAGIGKTRIAHEFAGHARSYKIPVLWGRCYEGDWSPPYAPWVEALSAAAKAFAEEELREALGQEGPTLAQLVPEIRAAFPGLDAPAPLSPGDERFRLFDAVVEVLLRLSAAKPVVLVLDDLHWADAASLGLLGHLGRFVGTSSLLVVGTYRDTELNRRHPLEELLANLCRERSFQRFRLRGLSRQEVAEFLATATASPQAIPPALTGAITEETSGNPFFIEELMRHLLEEGKLVDRNGSTERTDLRELGIPEGVRQVVRRRMARLSPAANRMLSHAVVFTGGFDFRVLQALTELSEDELLDTLDETLAAHLIEPVRGMPETYDFVHAIVRHALYEEWSPSRRVRLHRRLAEALERVWAGRERERAAELAAQFHASASLPDAERGIGYALTAAEQAKGAYASERAVTFLRMARDLAANAPAETRAEILSRLAVAEAEALLLGEARDSIEAALGALEEAQAPPVAVAAFLGAAAAALKDGGAPMTAWQPFVERGLAVVPAEEELTWARLMLLLERFEPVASGLINAARWLGTDPRAVDLARERGDEADYARTLQPFDGWSREWTADLLLRVETWQRPTAIVRALIIAGADFLYHRGDFRKAVGLFQELLAVSERHGSILGQAEAHVRSAIAQVALGELTAAQDSEARARDLVFRLGPGHRLHASAAWITALLAEYLGGDWAAIGDYWTRVVGDPRLGERTIGLDDAALAALAQARAGNQTEARRILDALTPVVARMEPALWLVNGAVDFGGAAVWALGAVDLAPAYRTAARGLIGAEHGDFPGGSHELTVARMASLQGNHAEAETYFARARLRLEATGQRPLRAIVDLDEATALAKAGRGDPLRREHLLSSALAVFRELGMAPWAGLAEAALNQAVRQEGRRAEGRPGGLTDREIEVVRLVARGQSDRQISDELYVSPRTVNAHIRNILGKTECGNRTELSVWAMEHGVFEESPNGRSGASAGADAG